MIGGFDLDLSTVFSLPLPYCAEICSSRPPTALRNKAGKIIVHAMKNHAVSTPTVSVLLLYLFSAF